VPVPVPAPVPVAVRVPGACSCVPMPVPVPVPAAPVYLCWCAGGGGASGVSGAAAYTTSKSQVDGIPALPIVATVHAGLVGVASSTGCGVVVVVVVVRLRSVEARQTGPSGWAVTIRLNQPAAARTVPKVPFSKNS
jgi:hypothetical protein